MADATALTASAFAAAFARAIGSGASGVVLAVSGGPDSVALMHLVARARSDWPDLPITVGTVDHGLRIGSEHAGALVAAQAAALGLPCRRLTWTGPKPARAVQEKAREARYGLLGALCAEVGADHLVTAHTLDDQAETLLFRLVRGSGLTGLGGMRALSSRDGVTLARPLLGVSKASLIATCVAFGAPFHHDPANADPRFARARLRRILPALAQEGFDTGSLARLAHRLARADAALETVAAAAFVDCRLGDHAGSCRLDRDRIAALQPEVLIRVLRLAVESVGGAAGRLDRLERLADRIAGARDRPWRATLGGAVVTSEAHGPLMLQRETGRRRGLGTSAATPRASTRPACDMASRPGVESFPWQA